MSGGGGGGGDYRRQQAELEAKKAAGRKSLNLQFGIFDEARPSSDGYQYPAGTGAGDIFFGGAAPRQYDVAQWESEKAAADANKAAREKLYTTVRQNAFDAGKRRLDETQTDAKRNLKFELFAKGLGGGSVDVDQNALLGRTYNQGLIDLGAKADTVRNTLKAGDESTRLNLLQSIDAGMDQGSALSSAIAQMQNASDAAAAEATGATVGDIFSNAGLLYSDSVKRKRQQDARDYWATVMSQPRAASSGASGTVTSTR